MKVARISREAEDGMTAPDILCMPRLPAAASSPAQSAWLSVVIEVDHGPACGLNSYVKSQALAPLQLPFPPKLVWAVPVGKVGAS